MTLHQLGLAGTLVLTGLPFAPAPASTPARRDYTRREVAAPAGRPELAASARPASLARGQMPGNGKVQWVQLAAPAAAGYPARATGRAFTVQPPAPAPAAGLRLSVVNVLGSVVYQRVLPTAAPVTVPAGVAPAGLYWVCLRGPQGYLYTQRLVLS